MNAQNKENSLVSGWISYVTGLWIRPELELTLTRLTSNEKTAVFTPADSWTCSDHRRYNLKFVITSLFSHRNIYSTWENVQYSDQSTARVRPWSHQLVKEMATKVCAIIVCPSFQDIVCNVFPKDPKTQKKWLEVTWQGDQVNVAMLRNLLQHLTPEDYIQDEVSHLHPDIRRWLKLGAIPTQLLTHMPTPSE